MLSSRKAHAQTVLLIFRTRLDGAFAAAIPQLLIAAGRFNGRAALALGPRLRYGREEPHHDTLLH